jgi:hypothetical protein
MKKFAISLVALAAVSTVAFANENRSNDLRDSDTYIGSHAQVWTGAGNNVEAFEVKHLRNSSGLTLHDFIDRSQEDRNAK